MALTNPSLPPRQCEAEDCESRVDLLRCPACHVVWYCSREHRISHRDIHKSECDEVKNNREEVAVEKERLRDEQGKDPFGVPDRVFEEHSGHFWTYLGTQPYMKKKYRLIESLLSIQTIDAIQAALDTSMYTVRLDRRDHLVLRSKIPSLMLQLNKDQECYDFVRWWYTCNPDGSYDWHDLSAPFLDTKNADVFEPCDLFINDTLNWAHIAAITLIKVRLLIDLESLQDASPTTPKKALSSVTLRRTDIMNSPDRTARMNDLKTQIRKLYDCVHKANKDFWQTLIDLSNNLLFIPPDRTESRRDKMLVALQRSYPAWEKTPGATDRLSELIISTT
ncbi:hypothetical protein F5Y06DRAFT_271143 [Hypoxylon sp. FL0890]|nr:hypothetical protein F5Y06DRAFT_271143 [Hypoxylon sp. FL0890]